MTALEAFEDENHPDIVESALHLAAQGLFVFPLHGIVAGRCTCGKKSCIKPQGKHPRVKWTKASTDNALLISEWWSKWPISNIGIDTGKSGLVVLDVDKKTGGMESLELILPEVPEIETAIVSQRVVYEA